MSKQLEKLDWRSGEEYGLELETAAKSQEWMGSSREVCRERKDLEWNQRRQTPKRGACKRGGEEVEVKGQAETKLPQISREKKTFYERNDQQQQ